MTPEEALDRLRETGLRKGVYVTDIRAGRCEITSLTTHKVTLTTESGRGNELYAGDAAVFLECYEKGSIQLVDDQ